METILWIRKKAHKNYAPMIKAGVQTMHFGRECETIKEAVFYLKCMESLLNNFKEADAKIKIKKVPQKGIQYEQLKSKKHGE